MQERGTQSERGPGVSAAGPQDQAGAEPEHDDPNVLDRVQRQQPLQVVLEERVDDPSDGGEHADGEHQHAEPDRENADPLDKHAHEPVQRDLDHHTAHQRRNRRRSDRVSARQPDMQRHHAGLRPHPNESRKSDRDLKARTGADRGRAAERVRVRKEQDRDPGADAAEMGDGEVVEHRLPRDSVCAAGNEDHGRREQRHQLPAHEEGQRIAGADDEGEREKEGRGERRNHTSSAGGLQIPEREHDRRSRDQPECAEKEPTQAVDAEAEIERAGKGRAKGAARPERPEAGEPHCGRTRRLHQQTGLEGPGAAQYESSPERDSTQTSDEERTDHDASRSWRIACCSVSCRVTRARPVSSRSKTRASSTR